MASFPESPKPGRVLAEIAFTYTCAEAVQCLVDLYTGRLADDEIVRLELGIGNLILTTHRSVAGKDW